MTRAENIIYSPKAGERGKGDLHASSESLDSPLTLLIHGGSWNHMDKSSVCGLADFLANMGCVAFNINYRLINSDPWPACLNDCLSAADYALNCEHEIFGLAERDKIMVVGVSAGAHLAMMTALNLPAGIVKGVISMAGPSDLVLLKQQGFGEQRSETFWQEFTGIGGEVTDKTLADASPINLLRENSPPMLMIHSDCDKIVDISHSQLMAEKCKSLGVRADMFTFDGGDEGHGFWQADTMPRKPKPEIEKAISDFIFSL